MSQLKIAVFVGSLRKDSFNRRLARAVEKLAPAEFTFNHVRIDDLPLYSQDFDGAYPAVASRLKQEAGRSRCGFCGGSLYLEAEDSPFARDMDRYVPAARAGTGAARRAS